MQTPEQQNKAPPMADRIRAIRTAIESLLQDPEIPGIFMRRSCQNPVTGEWKFYKETAAEHLHGAVDSLHLALDVVAGIFPPEDLPFREEYEDERLTGRQLGVIAGRS